MPAVKRWIRCHQIKSSNVLRWPWPRQFCAYAIQFIQVRNYVSSLNVRIHLTRFVIPECDLRKDRLIDCPMGRVHILRDSAVFSLLSVRRLFLYSYWTYCVTQTRRWLCILGVLSASLLIWTVQLNYLGLANYEQINPGEFLLFDSVHLYLFLIQCHRMLWMAFLEG